MLRPELFIEICRHKYFVILLNSRVRVLEYAVPCISGPMKVARGPGNEIDRVVSVSISFPDHERDCVSFQLANVINGKINGNCTVRVIFPFGHVNWLSGPTLFPGFHSPATQAAVKPWERGQSWAK
jgi:hypothetical protein